MSIGVLVQARFGSTRLPGKVLKPLGGESMLRRVLERAQTAARPDCVGAVVPYGDKDDPVAKEARSAGVRVVRGSEDDVLARFVQGILRYDLDTVVRLTADNPFVEGRVIDAMIGHLQERGLDYLHNVRGAGYPLGTCVEVVRGTALKEAFARSDSQADHEHVTPYIYDTDADYETGVFRREESADHMRLTVDTEEDYRLASWIFENVDGPPAEVGLDEILRLQESNPEKFTLNQSVRQKSIGD